MPTHPPDVPPAQALGVVLRSYTPDDWLAVCHVHDLARVHELARGGVDPRAFRTMAEAAEADEFFVSESLVACAAGGATGRTGAVIGFVSWNGAYVTWLYVDPAHCRRGIGRLLLDAALRRIGPEAWTTMIDGNAPALALYRSAGMEVVSSRTGHLEGYPCAGVRLALPTSRMRDPAAKRHGTPA